MLYRTNDGDIVDLLKVESLIKCPPNEYRECKPEYVLNMNSGCSLRVMLDDEEFELFTSFWAASSNTRIFNYYNKNPHLSDKGKMK